MSVVAVLCAPVALAGDSPEDTTRLEPCKYGYASVIISFGNERFTGDIFDAFAPGFTFQLGGGLRYRHLTLTGLGQAGGLYEFTDDFMSKTQHSEGSLEMGSGWGVLIDVGWQFTPGEKWRLEPFFGLRYHEIHGGYYVDNWRLDADSKLRPTVGARFKRRVGGRSGCYNTGWLYLEARISSLKFNNDEYGSGLGIQFSLGYSGEFALR